MYMSFEITLIFKRSPFI